MLCLCVQVFLTQPERKDLIEIISLLKLMCFNVLDAGADHILVNIAPNLISIVSFAYDYSYTELDSMPDGWRKAFGEQMCEDIREELVHAEYLDQYRISQIKEKYGTLRWYDFGCTERMLRDIIPKYEHLSARTCIRCGNPATKVSTGWISPYCDTCAGKISHAERFISIGEWLDRNSREVTSKRSLNEKDTHSL